jgi:2-keto-4-pentenoate hydratase/2-oxohepta-3-ene-1,7-dioic acid hydratase in catechol pathway
MQIVAPGLTRIASFRRRDDGHAGYGLVDGDDVTECDGDGAGLLGALNGDLATTRPRDGARSHALADVILLPPVAAPEKIICVGVNYRDRDTEYGDAEPAPLYPSLFVRFPGSLVGHEQQIVRPQESEQFDYEGEIVLVIGTGGRHIPRERALAHVAGVTLGNDGTIRDWLRHGKFNVTPGKNFDCSGSIGPWIVPCSELDLLQPLRLVTRVNGEVRQDDTTASMLFDFGRLIEYISQFTSLRAGDLIFTGTPTGAGGRSDPPRWLKAGDVVEVEVAEIGVLRNVVADFASLGQDHAAHHR